MTSNERIILKCLWDGEGRMHIQVIAQKTGVSSDYARLLCSSLERGEYLKFADVNVCCLLTKGRNRFQDSGPAVETAQDDAMVNPEIIIETVSVAEKDEQSSEDETSDNRLSDNELEDNGERIADFDIKINVEPELAEEEGSEAGDEKLVEEIQNEILKEGAELDELKDATPQEKEKLVEAGYKSAEDLAQAPVNRLIQSIGVNLKKAADWINQARRQTGAIDDKKVESKK